MLNEMTNDELMNVDGGLGNGGKAILAAGGAFIVGFGAPVAAAAVVSYGAVAVVTTFAGAQVAGYGMMTAAMSK